MNRRDLLKGLPLVAASGLSKSAQSAEGKLDRTARLRTAICAYSFRTALQNKTMTYDDLVRMAVEQDVDGLDLTVYWFPNASDEFLMPLRRLAYKMAVEIYSISIRTDMCLAPGAERDAEVEKVKGWVDAASKLGAGHIRVFGGRIPNGSTEDQAAAWCAETLKRGAEYAGSKGVILGLENHGGITERADTIIRIVKEVNSPWVGVNVDTGNFNRDGYKQLEMLVPYAVNVQMKTEIRVDEGRREEQDWDRMVRMLAGAGYKGYLALEYEAKEEPNVAVPRLMKKLREITRKYSA